MIVYEKIIPPINFIPNRIGSFEIKSVPMAPGITMQCPGHNNEEGKFQVLHTSYCHELIEHDRCTWMNDLPKEDKFHQEALKDFRGNVLIVGLGLGLFFKYINYEHLDLIEISQDCVDLVWPYFNDKENVNLYVCDIEDFAPKEYDYIYNDVFECDPALEEKFYNKFSPYCDNIVFWKE